MLNNIIMSIHLLLMQEVDGPAAERFVHHITQYIGDINTLTDRYSEVELRAWITTYWLQQVAAYTLQDTVTISYVLLGCHNTNEFIAAFRTTVLPIIQEVVNLPDIEKTVIPLSPYQPN